MKILKNKINQNKKKMKIILCIMIKENNMKIYLNNLNRLEKRMKICIKNKMIKKLKKKNQKKKFNNKLYIKNNLKIMYLI